jgi:RNA polymerase sigma factor (sigma-70 family)
MKNTVISEKDRLINEHHDLAFKFLKVNRLEIGEFYDVVIFGLMEAAERYANKPELRAAHSFESVAWTKMRDCMSRHWERQRARKRTATVISFEDFRYPDEFHNPARPLLDNARVGKILSFFDAREQRILSLLTDGFTERETAKEIGLTLRELRACREQIKEKAARGLRLPAAV